MVQAPVYVLTPFGHRPLKVDVIAYFIAQMWRKAMELSKFIKFLHSFAISQARGVQVLNELVDIAIYATKKNAAYDKYYDCKNSFHEGVYHKRRVWIMPQTLPRLMSLRSFQICHHSECPVGKQVYVCYIYNCETLEN